MKYNIDMGVENMREVKSPEVRKQEIMDCAMQLFAKKGYDNTTMSHIAKELHIAVGLCYHYFASKQELYNEALTNYAKSCSEDLKAVYMKKLPLSELRMEMLQAMKKMKSKLKYKEFFDKNKAFHIQLDRALAEELIPYVTDYVKELDKRGEITAKHPEVLAAFILYGEMPIFSSDEMKIEQKMYLVEEIINKLLC